MIDKHYKLDALRNLIAEKFPQPPITSFGRLSTECEIIDQNNGGLLKGSLTEVYGSSDSSQLLLAILLNTAVRNGLFIALIDGANSFEPSDWDDEQLCRILWVRCNAINTALKATDLLLRDGNLPILILNLQIIPISQLQRIPASTWYRFQRLIENTATILVIATPHPLVQGVPSRIELQTDWNINAMDSTRSALLSEVEMRNAEHESIKMDRFEIAKLRNSFSLVEKQAS